MKLFVKKLILWSKNPVDKPRIIPFVTDKINVLTGESGTGKSTISSIIDYCLGSEKCAIPIGMVRNKCAWYGLLLELDQGEVLLARRDPGSSQSTGDMFMAEGTNIPIPLVAPECNINVEIVKDKLNRWAGIPKIPMEDGRGDVARTDYPSFRDMAAFNFQPQHIVANPYTLFFKTDTTQHREKLQSIFPFVLGSVTPSILLRQRELRELEKEERQLKLDIESHRRAANRWLGEIESYYIQAMRYGLLPNGIDDRTGWTSERYLVELRAVRDSFEQNRPPEIEPGTGNRYAEELRLILDQENALAAEVGDMTRRLAKMSNLKSAFGEYQQVESENNDRLSSVGWLNKRLVHLQECPFCASKLNAPPIAFRRLIEVSEAFLELSRRVRVAPTRLDVERQTLQQTLRIKETELKAVRVKRNAIEDKNREQAQRRQDIRHIYFFAGQLNQALENYMPSERNTELSQRLAECQQRIVNLRKELDPAQIKARFAAAQESISRLIEQYAEGLLLEHRAENVSLDTKELTVKFSGTGGRTDFLFEVGSGQNWVGYHLATFFALHEFLVRRQENPVPTFLVVDQPSQVYFPESSWTSLEGAPVHPNGKSISEDIKGVQRIFGQMKAFLERTHHQIQIIVTEHAGEVTWKDIEDAVHLVGNWRDNQEDYLIPSSWN